VGSSSKSGTTTRKPLEQFQIDHHPEVVELWKAHGLELSPTLVGGEKYYYEVLRPQLLKEHKGEHVAISFDGSNAEVCFR
jgi:hypothetical protein